MSVFSKHGILCTLSICLFGFAGCGESGVVVEGSVLCNGKPADLGSVTFSPADGKGPSVGAPIAGGKYRIDGKAGLTPGKKQVDISATLKTGKQLPGTPPLPPGTMIDEILHFTAKETLEIAANPSGPHDFSLTNAGGPNRPR
jgi:hypothetical protein